MDFAESDVEGVREVNGGYEVTHDGAWVIYCPAVDGVEPPRVGEKIRTYGRGLGYSVRGIVIGGRVFRYQTEAEAEDEWKLQQRKREQEAEEKFVATVAETDRRILALPQPLRDRILAFQKSGGHVFRRDLEGYELFCCEQGAVIVDALRSLTKLRRFQAADWDKQRAMVPALSDGHSGNTFGMACLLARMLMERPEMATRIPGALSPIVGSDAYHTEAK